MSNFSSWHAYAKLVSKIPYNPYLISPISLLIFPLLLSRSHVVGAVVLHMKMAVRPWRLTAERPVQFGLMSCAFGGPGEGPFHSFLPRPQAITTPPSFHSHTQPLPRSTLNQAAPSCFVRGPNLHLLFCSSSRTVQIALITITLNFSSNYLLFQASFTSSYI
jgi:hypothetical protein